jgi:hypothetical protein
MNFYNLTDYCKIYEGGLQNVYYKNMVNTGFVSNLVLFDENCKCSINGEQYTGAYYVLIKLAENGMHRFNYLNFSGSCQNIPQGVLINVTGKCQVINFSNVILGELHFSETFLICTNKNKIINYICKYFI